jgi:hypothetical protein
LSLHSVTKILWPVLGAPLRRTREKKKVNTDELPLTELSRKSPASGIYIFYLCFAQESITPNHSSFSLSYPSLAALHKAYLQAASELPALEEPKPTPSAAEAAPLQHYRH